MKITLLLILSLILITGCMSASDCRNIALKEANSFSIAWVEIGRNQGIEICEDRYKPLLEQCKNLIGNEKYEGLSNGTYFNRGGRMGKEDIERWKREDKENGEAIYNYLVGEPI